MKTTTADTHIEVLCNCPNCDAYLDIFDEYGVKESMGYEPRSENCDLEINCSECKETFLVTDINF